MSALALAIKEMIEEDIKKRNYETLMSVSDNVFEHILYHGVTSEDSCCAGMVHNGIYLSEHEIISAYFSRNQDAEPLF